MRYELAGMWYDMLDLFWGAYGVTSTPIRNAVKGKSVAVVGNSPTIFNSPNPIDTHDVVVRINKAYPNGMELHLGHKTHILVCAYNLSPKTIKKEYGTPLLFWAFEPQFAHPYWRHNAYLYGQANRWKLTDKLGGAKPSSGLIFIDWLCQYGEFKDMTLYGFDFFKEKSWWLPENEEHPHNGGQEEEHIKLLQLTYPITIWRNDG